VRKRVREPKPPKPTPKPPKEAKQLLEKDYRHLNKLKARGWFWELKRLHELSIKHSLGLHTDDPKIKVYNIAGNTRIVVQAIKVVQFVGPRDQGVNIPQHLLPALVVNVNVPDKIIFAAFKRELKEVRKHFKPPLAKRGRYAPNSLFDKDTFAKWRGDKIVQLSELFAWRGTLDEQEKRLYPNHVLGEWLGMDGKEATSKAKATLEKALACLPALMAQLKYDKDPVRMKEDLIEAQAAEDPIVAQIAAEFAKDM
jgi:hypothetical protein